MKSMTGFGRDETETDLGKIVVEGRSENHRFLDINFQIPEALSAAEPRLTEIVKKYIVRGKVRINIAVEGLRNKSTTVDIGLAKESLKTLEKLKKELGLKGPTELQHLLMIRDFFSSEVKPSLNKKHIAKIEEALLGTVKKLDEMRKSEGKKLERDLKQRTQRIETLIRKIGSKREDFMRDFSNKLRERIQELLEDTQIDETRFNQEIVFLAERSDITEEIVRLGAHISKLKETFGKEGSIGRELDFLLQEMNREANTIAAKSKDAEISHFVIELRSEMEKIREQIQNIE
ncbi:MAG TPA: YicC/YloC family endoribonuclease [Thermodesulfobacteriota bacterium]|nr:YicC/YloC family endoribonuclease [Thermodesulfobacteriota bacterium]